MSEADLKPEVIFGRWHAALLTLMFGSGGYVPWKRRLPETGKPARAAVALVALGVAVIVNWFSSVPISGMVLLAYLPAIFVATVLSGWLWGLFDLLASGVFVWWSVAMPSAAYSQDGNFDPSFFLMLAAATFLIAGLVREAIRASRRNETRLLRLVNAEAGVVFVTDGEQRPYAPGPSWAGTTGMTWPEYRGRGWIDAIHPNDRPHLPNGPLAEGEMVHQREIRVRDGRTNEWRWHRLRSIPVTDKKGRIIEWVGTLRDIHERRLESEKRDLVIGELRHRMKNLMTVIEALAKSSRRRNPPSPDVDEFLQRFLGRLHALTAAADLVLAGNRVAIEAKAVIGATLAPFREEGTNRLHVQGPELQLSEATGGSLALAVHELATNALKYGALSVPNGSVSLVWHVTPVESGEEIVFEWKENGGPKPEPPEREGFGGRVIKSVTAREKSGSVAIEYPPDGVYCRIAFVREKKSKS